MLLKRRGYFAARVWVGRKRPVLAMHSTLDEGEANARAQALSEMAASLRDAGMTDDAIRALEIAAEARPGEEWSNACAMIDVLCAGQTEALDAADIPTIEQFAKLWTSGELAHRYPDQVRPKDTSDRDEQRFRLHINPVIGLVRLDRFTLDHADRVVAAIATKDLRPKTRQQVKQALATLIGYAVYPAKIIASNPIPPRWVKTADAPRAKSYLYPSEDAMLMACRRVPLRDRLFYGFLAREGCRRGEALALRWLDLDLTVGSIRLDANKTDDPRAWALDPGTVQALTRYKARYRADAAFTELVFIDDAGHVDEANSLRPTNLRASLREAGVARSDLYEDSKTRQPIRVHDLRATFVTTALANGKTETFVADRTGHRSSTMINRYRRAARTHNELDLGTLVPLNEAIPELGDDDGAGDEPRTTNGVSLGLDTPLDTKSVSDRKTKRPHGDLNGHTTHHDSQEMAFSSGDFMIAICPDHPRSTAHVRSNVQSNDFIQIDDDSEPEHKDPVREALGYAIKRAADEGRWDIVLKLAGVVDAPIPTDNLRSLEAWRKK